MGCVSCKSTIKLTNDEKLEIEKLEGVDLSIKLVSLVSDIDRYRKDDKQYVLNKVQTYLSK